MLWEIASPNRKVKVHVNSSKQMRIHWSTRPRCIYTCTSSFSTLNHTSRYASGNRKTLTAARDTKKRRNTYSTSYRLEHNSLLTVHLPRIYLGISHESAWKTRVKRQCMQKSETNLGLTATQDRIVVEIGAGSETRGANTSARSLAVGMRIRV